jgi:hypothetical protein
MIPINQVGYILEGPLEGWFIKVQHNKAPAGLLVSRARNVEMDLTVILDGVFAGLPETESFFRQNAPKVDWEVGGR